MGLSVRRLVGDYQRLVCSSDAHNDGAGSSKADKLLAVRVWEDVDRTMSPRHTGRSGQISASLRGGGGYGCPAHFTEGSRHAVFRYMGGGLAAAGGCYCQRAENGVLVKNVQAATVRATDGGC